MRIKKFVEEYFENILPTNYDIYYFVLIDFLMKLKKEH